MFKMRVKLILSKTQNYVGDIMNKSELPPKLLSIIKPNEKILKSYNVYGSRKVQNFLGVKDEYIPGKLVITNRNVYLYASSYRGTILKDIPLQKITIIKFVLLKSVPFFTAKKIINLLEEFERRKKLLKKGVLKIASSWEDILCVPLLVGEDNPKEAIEKGYDIILTIKRAMEGFYPEPLSLVEENDKHHYYLSLKVPHRHIPKQEVIFKPHTDIPETSIGGIKEQLKALKDLYEEGLITEEEYKRKKEELLSRL